MNTHQIAYKFARGIYSSSEALLFPLGALNAIGVITELENFSLTKDGGNLARGLVEAAVVLFIAKVGLECLTARLRVSSEKRRTNPERNPLEYAAKLVIEDEKGLDTLLEKTRSGEKKEWGTVFCAKDSQKSIYVNNILDPETAVSKGIITKAKATKLVFNEEAVKRDGFTGLHHYHINLLGNWLGGIHFAVSQIDRACCNGRTNLLTFNMPEGPEIVGFNLRHTYIPEDASKRVLVRASPSDIMKYLGGKK